jgi:hypothetical protein
MSVAAIVLSALFALGMMSVALAVLVKGAHETDETPAVPGCWKPAGPDRPEPRFRCSMAS